MQLVSPGEEGETDVGARSRPSSGEVAGAGQDSGRIRGRAMRSPLSFRKRQLRYRKMTVEPQTRFLGWTIGDGSRRQHTSKRARRSFLTGLIKANKGRILR